MKALRLSLCLVLAGMCVGCGTYRTTYVMRGAEPDTADIPDKRKYAHGIGIIGGGGYFFALHRIFPAWVTWSKPINISQEYPEGIYSVEQYHTFGQNSLAALFSWLILVNPYHSSVIEIKKAAP